MYFTQWKLLALLSTGLPDVLHNLAGFLNTFAGFLHTLAGFLTRGLAGTQGHIPAAVTKQMAMYVTITKVDAFALVRIIESPGVIIAASVSARPHLGLAGSL